MPKSREQMLEEHFRAENEHDVPAIMETFAPDGVLVWGGKPYRGREVIAALHEGLGFGGMGAFSDLEVVEIRRHVTEAAIVVEQEVRGRHTGTYEGVPATGRSIAVPACTVYEFDEDGLLVSERPYLDRWVLWKQIHA
jgi:steroid delta-isomerase-like uncharacterized protein